MIKIEPVKIFGITVVATCSQSFAPASLGIVGLSSAVPNGVKQGAAPCTDATRGSSENCPRPVKIVPGFYGTSIDDRLTATSETRYYSLNANAGQQLILSFAGDGPLQTEISFPGGGRNGPLDNGGNTIFLPTTGTYIISISRNMMEGTLWYGRFSIAFVVR